MSVALIKARDWESESKIKRLVGDLSHHHLNSEYLNGLRNSLIEKEQRASPFALLSKRVIHFDQVMHRAQPELDLTYAWFRSSRRLESCPSGAQARGRSGSGPRSSRPALLLPRVGLSAPEEAVLGGIRPGRALVRLQQRRPWERDQPAAQMVELQVEVRT